MKQVSDNKGKMRILVISDSHGRNNDIEGVIEQVGKIDVLIHCGDVERGDDYIRELAKCPSYMVSGNNDYNISLPQELFVEIGGYKVLITHGHRYYVNGGTSLLKKYALEKGADIVMYGHTHIPYFEADDNLIVLNPGSLSYPRQEGRKPTFLLMEIDDMGEAHFAHGYYKSKFYEMVY